MFTLADRFWGLLPLDLRGTSKSDKFILWIDAVGGYWVCLGNKITIGQSGGSGNIDVPILGDISPRHAQIHRDGEGYLIKAIREVRVDGRPVRPTAHLNDGCLIELGATVRLIFRKP